MFRLNFIAGETRMPVYQFICKKHGRFEKITIKAEWDDIRCPKCGANARVDQKCIFEHDIFMKKLIINSVIALLLGGAALIACSNNQEAEQEPEKGVIEEMTDRAAKEAVNRIRTPLNKARSAADQEEERLNDMDESLKK